MGDKGSHADIEFNLIEHQCTLLQIVFASASSTTATRLCVSKLWVQTLSGLRSNYVYINHMNPMIEGVDLVYPREVKNIHLPDKEGALPTDGSGKIKIRGQYLGKNNEKAAVIFRGR